MESVCDHCPDVYEGRTIFTLSKLACLQRGGRKRDERGTRKKLEVGTRASTAQ